MDYYLYTTQADESTCTGRAKPILEDNKRLDQLAKEHRFQRRARGKITPRVFLRTMIDAALSRAVSFRQLAVLGGTEAKTTIAKQSFWQRVGREAFEFLGAVLCQKMGCGKLTAKLQGKVRRVLISDSTTHRFHPTLHKAFPGSSNQIRSRKYAVCRCQITLDLLSGQVIQASLSGFNRNDQAAASDVLDVLQAGDLLLRDLGYFTFKSLAAIAERNAFFLSRLRYGSNLFDECDCKIDLRKTLRSAVRQKRNEVLFEARLGKRMKLPVRAVAVRLPEALAAERRRKARADRDKHINHSAAYYELLGWAILVTNLPAELLGELDLAEVYALRWRIENFFKAWKSGLRPEVFSQHRSNQWHLRCLLIGQMLALNTLANSGYFALRPSIGQASGQLRSNRLPSIFKLLDILLLCGLPGAKRPPPGLLEAQLRYHGLYESRKRIPLPEAAIRILA